MKSAIPHASGMNRMMTTVFTFLRGSSEVGTINNDHDIPTGLFRLKARGLKIAG